MWRWHFYAGIIFAPFIIVLALSGSVYLFKNEIEAYQYRNLFYANQAKSPQKSLEQQYRTVSRAHPNYQISSILVEHNQQRTTEFTLYLKSHAAPEPGGAKPSPENLSVFVNPFTGKIQGQLDNNLRIMPVFKKVHSELLIGGTLANRWVELAACWTLVLTLTGLYLWWPSGKFSVWGTFLPRFNRKGRAWWRELHAVTAVWISVVLVILILSGLSWAQVMGPRYRALGKWSEQVSGSSHDSMYPRFASRFGPKPKSDMTMKDIATVPWAAEGLPVPTSEKPTPTPLSLDTVQQVAIDKNIIQPYVISLPQGEDGVFTLATLASNPVNEATINVDQYSGKLITDFGFRDYGWLGKTITLGIAFHEGRLWGLPNQIVNLLAAWGAVLLSVTGWMMWWKRKPKGMFGTPQAPANPNASRFLAACLIILGLLFPPLGISLVVVYLVEKLVIRNIPPLKSYFAL